MLIGASGASAEKFNNSVGIPVPSPIASLEQCAKGCVVFIDGSYSCMTKEETLAPKFQALPSACKTPQFNPAPTLSRIDRLRQRADSGDSEAQFSLGYEYASGREIARDDREAVKWYRQAAEAGNTSAQSNLGVMYSKGLGVEKNANTAVKWYHRAAENGNTSAQFNLGRAYAMGEGVEKNYQKARKWLRLAGDAGSNEAQLSLVELYAAGLVAANDDIDMSSPEATLAGYIDSLRSGNASGVLERYEGRGFYIHEPSSIQEYKVVKKIIYGVQEIEAWGDATPEVKLGDVEFQVSQIEDGAEYMYSYWFRNSRNTWKMYSHVRWD